MKHDLEGKVILITGATDGIGKAAAMDFAKRGATMTIVGRNKEKTTQVLAELKDASGNQNLDLLLCDLSRMADVKRAAEAFKAKHDRLDVLVNNAGATFKRLSGTTATANCFEPGSVRTQFGGFGSDMGLLMNLVYAVARPFSKTPEQGADSLLWLATSPEAASRKGQFVSNRRPVDPSKQALDPKLAADLWTLSEKLCAEAKARSPLLPSAPPTLTGPAAP
ncbi:SDR family NAD(P)-dependent oxidoreductase [Polyangium fumosum]|uniref:SDR family NAD(P)-dependent oxidoreductase n=1 Tax=Polyangium fumosum TaxID=889272 RepID=A0A4U1IUJ9_9BACT|nr:SDR family NAD(P)-dependent oxidoreductase [Polyangium fumosum]TKC98066.1 SDR family NAD(P)-dependent oxidoreductase [Polyangium fumosum]